MKMTIKLTVAEGRVLMNLMASYGAALRFQNERNPMQSDIPWPDLSAREDLVGMAWKLLKKSSERSGESGWLFGGLKAEKDAVVTLALHDDEKDGIYWTLLSGLDPRSLNKQPISVAEDYLWPIAEKIKAVPPLRKDLKLNETKKQKIEYEETVEPTEANGNRVEPDLSEKKN